MNSTISLLLVFLNQFFMPRHNAQLRLLKAQIAILRARIPTQRIILSPAEKAELLRIGEECGHDIDGLMEVAKPATYKRWLAQMRGGRRFQAVGRSRLTQELRDVVIRIGSEISVAMPTTYHAASLWQRRCTYGQPATCVRYQGKATRRYLIARR